jgi:hypothetical protein
MWFAHFPSAFRAARAWASLISKSAPPLIQRAIEEIVHHIQPTCFLRLQPIDIAVFENASGER